jgi:glycerol-3-phosphate acyltransferase PlsY
MIIIAPWAALVSAVVWLIIYGIARTTFIASFFMIFILSCGQALTLHWQISAITCALATFLLILFNHRKNIIDYKKKHLTE